MENCGYLHPVKQISIMRKVVGIGETILDILFRNGQPTAAVPGGSVFNCIVSLSRADVPIHFISETGEDEVGEIVLDFMKENNVPTDHIYRFSGGKSPISLAFLNEQNDAHYLFYKKYPRQRLDVDLPELNEDDIVILGSYYALNPELRDKILELLREKKALFKGLLQDLPGVGFRKINDPGECATLLTLLFDTRERAAKFCEILGTAPVANSGWHVYNNMEQVLNKVTATRANCPYDCPRFESKVEYRKHMLPQTDDILDRAVNLSVGVVDKGVGSGCGININSTTEEIEATAAKIREVVLSL